jgi:hypothetical protein
MLALLPPVLPDDDNDDNDDDNDEVPMGIDLLGRT